MRLKETKTKNTQVLKTSLTLTKHVDANNANRFSSFSTLDVQKMISDVIKVAIWIEHSFSSNGKQLFVYVVREIRWQKSLYCETTRRFVLMTQIQYDCRQYNDNVGQLTLIDEKHVASLKRGRKRRNN